MIQCSLWTIIGRNLNKSLFNSINKRFYIKEKPKKKEMPKVYPLESLRISRSVKYAKSPNNLFVIIENDRFIFFVVNQDYIIPSNEISSMQHTIKVIKNILNLPNYFILESNENELGNFGTVAFEVRYKEIHGMEFTNSLLQDSWRIVTECQLLRKKSFRNVVEMLKYYKISYTFEQDSSVLNKE